jgi:hypothetical protein
MSRATEIITREILRAEKNFFIFRLFLTVACYVGITVWLNAVRQTVSAWLLWTLIAVQLLLFLTIFVVSFLRLRQCRTPSWWLLAPLLMSRINNWEILAIPATIIVMLILSERNKHVSQERAHLLPPNEHVVRLEALMKGPAADRKWYEDMVFAFSDLMATHSPLIGDCSLLPYPKGILLYAIKWVMEEYETNRDATNNEELRQTYDKMLPTLSYLFTRLARDWQEIDPADKGAVAKLHDCESFPQWALPLKQKYIDDERASKEAAETAFQVMKDRMEQKKSTV